MLSLFHLLEFIHILTAILALGTSAGLGIVLEFYGEHPLHGGYVLGLIERLFTRFVLPGYGLMLLTGLGMAGVAQLWEAQWVRTAIVLWSLGLVALGADRAVLVRQIGQLAAAGRDSARYRRLSLAGRALGAVGGLVVVAILAVMVFKPEWAWLPW